VCLCIETVSASWKHLPPRISRPNYGYMMTWKRGSSSCILRKRRRSERGYGPSQGHRLYIHYQVRNLLSIRAPTRRHIPVPCSRTVESIAIIQRQRIYCPSQSQHRAVTTREREERQAKYFRLVLESRPYHRHCWMRLVASKLYEARETNV
jgi:hypothetical protein